MSLAPRAADGAPTLAKRTGAEMPLMRHQLGDEQVHGVRMPEMELPLPLEEASGLRPASKIFYSDRSLNLMRVGPWGCCPAA